MTSYIEGFSYWETSISVNIYDILGPTYFPFVLSFLLPVFMHTIILEKENKQREMMKMMGLKMSHYWLINFIFDYFLYLIMAFSFCLAGFFVSVRLFTQTRWKIYFNLFF